MRLRLFMAVAFALGVLDAGPALAQLTPTPGGTVTPSQKVTAVNSGSQNQASATASFALPAVGLVIQQTLFGLALVGPDTEMAMGPSLRGLAAGDEARSWQVWIQGGGGESISSLTNGYDLANYGTQVGIQTQISPKFLLGVSGSWQGSDGSLDGGFSSTSSTFGVAAYAGWQFHEHWNASAIVGWSNTSTDLTNRERGRYSASYRSRQWIVQGGLNGYYKVGDVVLSPLVSLLHVPITTYDYDDSTGAEVRDRTTELTRGSVGGFLIVPLTGWQPYIRATVEHDFDMPAGSAGHGRTGGTVGAGATIPFNDSVWASVDAGYNSLGRDGLTLWSASARLNLRF